MEDWFRNFRVQIGSQAPTSTKRGFYEIQPSDPPSGGERQKHVFEHISAPNYLTMTKLYMGRLDINTKKIFSMILEFSVLQGGKEEEMLNFEKFEFSNITRL